MLTLLETDSARRFIVTRPASVTYQSKNEHAQAEDSWLLWLFTPDLHFCSTAAQQATKHETKAGEPAGPIRACKILYRRQPSSTSSAEQMQSSNADFLPLPLPLRTALFEALFASAELLPRAARTYGPWQVGLLRRFASGDLSPDK